MTDQVISFVIFWGIWLFLPMLIDGGTTLFYLIGVWRIERRRKSESEPDLSFPPLVTIVIPVYNGEKVLGSCLASIRRQTYPHSAIEVIVVNNRSADRSFEVFQYQQEQPFGGQMIWMSVQSKGKPWALNAGYHTACGQYLCNIDADIALREDAIENAVKALLRDPKIAAITAAVEVLPLEGPVSPLRRLLAECEYLEYYSGFRIGRQYQSAVNSLFTLAGAFSMFRREILLQTFMYSKQTVSEDTHLTFDIHNKFAGARIACVPNVVAYTEPTESLSQFYAQRVRWQRGELEVIALHPDLLKGGIFRLHGLAPARTLVVDHTLAFPRVVWTILLPMLYFFGYSLQLVVAATLAMYISYVMIEGVSELVSYRLAEKDGKQRIRQYWWIFTLIPAYRFMMFWFRLGGFVSVLTEPAVWSTATPWHDTERGLDRTRHAVVTAVLQIGRTLGIQQ